MITNVRFVLAIVLLSSIGVFISSTGFARQTPEQYAPATAQRQEVQTTTLTGVWTLNAALSDDSARVMAAIQSQRRAGTGHGPWLHGGGGGGRNPGETKAMQERMHRAMDAPASLAITQTTGSITFADGRGRSQTFTTNDKKQTVPLDDRTVEVRSKWDDGRLIKETSLGDGLKLMETFSLASGHRQLHVTVKLEGSHLPQAVNVRRVYDLAKSQ